MSVAQYHRKLSVIVGQQAGDAIDLSGLNIKFNVRRGDVQTPNTADFRIYNVSDTTAQKICDWGKSGFTRIVLQAGYAGNFGVIFDGDIKQAFRGRESATDTYVDVIAADGDFAYNYASLSMSLAAGSDPNDHIGAILKPMLEAGLEKGYVPEFEKTPLPRGKVLYGDSKKLMRQVTQNTQTKWSIQDGKITMIPETAYLPGEIPVISSNTGMIGIPTQTQGGIEITILLNPGIRVGQAIKLDNAAINSYKYGLSLDQQADNVKIPLVNKTNADGLYYVMEVNTTGESRGNNYYSILSCLAIDATLPSLGTPKTYVIGEEYINTIPRRG